MRIQPPEQEAVMGYLISWLRRRSLSDLLGIAALVLQILGLLIS